MPATPSVPYKSLLLFLIGQITFCLGIIVGVFASLDMANATVGLQLGSVLAWTALTALAGTAMCLLIQVNMQGDPAGRTTVGGALGYAAPSVLTGVGMTAAAVSLGIRLARQADPALGSVDVLFFFWR